MEQLKDVRALRRGLCILDILSRNGPHLLSELARAAGLPKSTARRILATLEDTGYVRRNLGDNLFRSNIALPGLDSAGLDSAGSAIAAGPIVQAAKPVLQSLSQEFVWPSDLFIRDGHELQIVETTRPLTPLLVNRNEIGDRVDLCTTAVGRAYLAFCPAAEREELIAALMPANPQYELAELKRATDEARENGFAVRDPRCTGATRGNPYLIDRLYAIAVPVLDGERVACVLNMLWPIAAAASVGDETVMAGILKKRAAEISANLRRQRN